MQEQASNHDKKRVFYSTVMNDNLIDCITSKATVVQVSPKVCVNLDSGSSFSE